MPYRKQKIALSNKLEEHKLNIKKMLIKINNIKQPANYCINHKKYEAEIYELDNKLIQLEKKVEAEKKKNSILRGQNQLVSEKAENLSDAQLSKLQYRLDTITENNIKLFQEIQNKKNLSRKAKFNEKYIFKKNTSNIKSYAEEIKLLTKKKKEHHLKLLNNKDVLNNCIANLKSIEDLYNEYQEKKNYSNRKVEEEITKLKMDLQGDENEIFEKVEQGKTLILIPEVNFATKYLNTSAIKKAPKKLKLLSTKPNNNQLISHRIPEVKSKIMTEQNIKD